MNLVPRFLAARLERSSFYEEERRAKKREWKADIAAQTKITEPIQPIAQLKLFSRNLL